jgi:hypothetical protein
MAKGGNIMNKLIYKGYVIEVKEKMYLVKIKDGIGGWVLDFPEEKTDLVQYVKNHIDNHFSKQDKKNGRI